MAIVYIVDDDDAVRKSLSRVLRAEGIEASCHPSADDFLRQNLDPEVTSCLLLDVKMPAMSGLELQRRLAETGSNLPVIFLTGHGDIPMSVKAMKRGAADFLTKPVDAEDLLRAIRRALSVHRRARETAVLESGIRARIDSLTPREREVMHQLITGVQNKVVAERLGISVKTVKIHRANVMKKMDVRSVTELLHLCHLVAIDPVLS